MFTEAKSQRTRERVPKSLPQRNLALVTCSLYSPTHQIKSNQNTFVQRRMSQANQRRIVAETWQSVHVHYRQCQTFQS